MQITHDALNAPLPILRAMYELQMKRTDSFFLEVQKRSDNFLFLIYSLYTIHHAKGHILRSHTASLLCLCVIFRFDGEEIKTDETIRTLAQKWQPNRRPRSEERNTKAVDTDMIVVSCMVSCLNVICLIMNCMFGTLLVLQPANGYVCYQLMRIIIWSTKH